MGVVIHRNRHAQEYVVVPNAIARNTQLSFLARGLLVMLLSLPPDWHVTTDMLAEDNPDSRTGIREAMRELRAAGYVQLLGERGKDGRTRRHLEVYDIPQPNAGTPRLVPPAQTRIPAGRTKRRIPTVGETAVKESTGPKYGPESTENSRAASSRPRSDRSAANSQNPRVHDGPDHSSSDAQQIPDPVTRQSSATDRNAREVDQAERQRQPGNFSDIGRPAPMTARETAAEARRQADALTEWTRQHPEAAP
jgi:hypothetical protein